MEPYFVVFFSFIKEGFVSFITYFVIIPLLIIQLIVEKKPQDNADQRRETGFPVEAQDDRMEDEAVLRHPEEETGAVGVSDMWERVLERQRYQNTEDQLENALRLLGLYGRNRPATGVITTSTQTDNVEPHCPVVVTVDAANDPLGPPTKHIGVNTETPNSVDYNGVDTPPDEEGAIGQTRRPFKEKTKKKLYFSKQCPVDVGETNADTAPPGIHQKYRAVARKSSQDFEAKSKRHFSRKRHKKRQAALPPTQCGGVDAGKPNLLGSCPSTDYHRSFSGTDIALAEATTAGMDLGADQASFTDQSHYQALKEPPSREDNLREACLLKASQGGQAMDDAGGELPGNPSQAADSQ